MGEWVDGVGLFLLIGCLNQDLQDFDGFSGWLAEWVDGVGLFLLIGCLNQDLQDFDGFSGWLAEWVDGGTVVEG